MSETMSRPARNDQLQRARNVTSVSIKRERQIHMSMKSKPSHTHHSPLPYFFFASSRTFSHQSLTRWMTPSPLVGRGRNFGREPGGGLGPGGDLSRPEAPPAVGLAGEI